MATELACEWQQQSQCIAITGLSVEREVVLRHHMLEQEAPDPEAKQIAVIHDCPSHCEYCAKRRPDSSSNSGVMCSYRWVDLILTWHKWVANWGSKCGTRSEERREGQTWVMTCG